MAQHCNFVTGLVMSGHTVLFFLLFVFWTYMLTKRYNSEDELFAQCILKVSTFFWVLGKCFPQIWQDITLENKGTVVVEKSSDVGVHF